MAILRSLSEDEDMAEVELANGDRIRVPRAAVPRGTKLGKTFQPQARRSTRAIGRASQAFQFYVSQGLEPHMAAGIVGNAMQESGSQLNPGAVGDQGTAFGIFQHRGQRFANLRRFASAQGKDWRDVEVQLAFPLHEMGITSPVRDVPGFGSEGGAGRRLLASSNVRQATEAVVGFERPKGFSLENPGASHGFGNRLRFAEDVFGMRSTGSGGTAVSAAAMNGDTSAADQTPAPVGDDSIRSRLRSLLSGDDRRRAAPVKKRTRGQVVQDVVSSALSGLAAGGGATELPQSPFQRPEEFGQISAQQAAVGPLPRLGEGITAARPPRLSDIF